MPNYVCTEEPFYWNKEGADPTDSEASLGLQGGMALPASFVNQQWYKTYRAIMELQIKVSQGVIKSGDVVVLGSDNTIGSNPLKSVIIVGNENTAASDVADYCDCAIIMGDGNTYKHGGYDEIQSVILSGTQNEATNCYDTFIYGEYNTVKNTKNCFVAGLSNTITSNVASGIKHSATFGQYNTGVSGTFVCGKGCKAPTGTAMAVNTGDLFVIGNGVGTTSITKSNAFRVTADGKVMGTQAYTASGADFAEMFEWADGNTDNEDRRGLFVTLDGDKIRLANSEDDYILGAVSAAPTVIGGAYTDDWQGKYVTDVFGERTLVDGAWQLSESFDKAMDDNYTSRLERHEWAAVGLVGKLVVVDDGTCEVNGYCYPGKNGIATAIDSRYSGYRVIKRIDESHILVVVK